ncbi:hypothetical protein DI383_00855 [Flavobacteriaceae bacterium LYZ1037]|nr:hypothetical protein DI383_00855 [Flavobacteriaceae bacterium LYZ1037]
MEYFIKASVVLGIFYICYKLFLQKETFYNANRWYLFLGLLVSTLVPLLVIPIYVEYTELTLPNSLVSDSSLNDTVENSITFFQLINWIYLFGFAFFFGKLVIEFASLFVLIKNNKKKKVGRFTFIETTNNVPPFSFFNWIVYNPSHFHENELLHIINHEKVHAKQFHSIDVMLCQISCIVFWINPICWLYKKELQQNLEFIADNKAQEISECEKSYQRLLVKASLTNHQLMVTNNFYNSLIKKRIVMLHKSKSNKLNVWKLFLVLPLLGLFLMSFNTKEVYINTSGLDQTSTNNLSEKATVIITKDFTDTELEKIKNKLLQEGLTLKFKGVKRNTANEIIAIKIDVKSKESSANYNTNGMAPIAPIKISFNTDGNQISIGNVSIQSSKHTMAFITKDGHAHKINSSDESENVFVLSTDDKDSNKEFEIVSNGGIVFTSEDGEIQTIKDGDGTIEIITISDDGDGETLVYDTKSHGKSKKVWLTKEETSGDHEEKNYEVKIISPDKDGLHFTTQDPHTKQKVKIVKMNAKDGAVITNNGGTPLFFLDGKEITKEEMEKINPDIIASVNVLKGEKAIEKHGEKAKDGIVEIITKK